MSPGSGKQRPIRRRPEPAKAKAHGNQPRAEKSPKTDDARVRDLETRLAEAVGQLQTRDRQLIEAQEQQTATSAILRVISTSPIEAQPVFSAIAESVARLTGAVVTTVYEFDGSLVHLRAAAPSDYPHADSFRQNFPRPPAPDFAAGRVILDRTVLHRADLQNDPDTPELTRAWARRMDLRSVLWVPMLRGAAPIGVIGAVRREIGLFADDEVRLLQRRS